MNVFDDLAAKQKGPNKLHAAISLFLQGFIALAVCFGAWTLVKEPNLVYENLPWAIGTEVAVFKAGDVVPLRVDRCNKTNEPLIYEVTRGIKNVDTGVTTILQSTRVTADPGCHAAISMLHALPHDIAPGTYIITGVGVIPDLFNDKTVHFESKPFQVVR